jgi:hypothetical protein
LDVTGIVQPFGGIKFENLEHFGGLGIDGSIILKWILFVILYNGWV